MVFGVNSGRAFLLQQCLDVLLRELCEERLADGRHMSPRSRLLAGEGPDRIGGLDLADENDIPVVVDCWLVTAPGRRKPRRKAT